MKAFYENRKYKDKILIDVIKTKNMNFFAHWHSDIEIMYVCKGSMGVGINKEYHVLNEGDVSICASDDIHYYSSEGMMSSGIMIIFRPEIFDTSNIILNPKHLRSIIINRDYCDKNNVSVEVSKEIKKIVEIIIKEYDKEEIFFDKLLKLKIIELILLLYRNFPPYYSDCSEDIDKPFSENKKPMQKALKYLEKNYQNVISLDDIANEAGLSNYYFSRLFKETTGINFISYLTHLRINKAEELIKMTKKNIIDIAYDTGFCSIRTFNRSFKKIRGCTPQSLRNKYMV